MSGYAQQQVLLQVTEGSSPVDQLRDSAGPAVLAVVMMSNSLSTVDIVNQQTGAGLLSWNICHRCSDLLDLCPG